jgi:hypothetical protein
MALINTLTGLPESRPMNLGGSIGNEADGDRPERTTAPEPVSILPPEVVAAALEAEAAPEPTAVEMAEATEAATEASPVASEPPATAAPATPAPVPAPPAASHTPARAAVEQTRLITAAYEVTAGEQVTLDRQLAEKLAHMPGSVAPIDRIAAARAALIAAGLPTDVIDGTPPVLIGPGVVSRAATATGAAATSTWHWSAWIVGLVKSVRTLLFFSVGTALGILDSLKTIDLTGFISHLTGKDISSGDLVAAMSIAGILLRLITNGPAFARWKRAAQGGGGSDSKVDDPA